MPITDTYYALRRKGTDCYMLLRETNNGYTHSEFEHISNGRVRLFKSELGAKLAFGWWKRGKVQVDVTEDGDDHWSIDLTPERAHFHVELVKLQLTVVEARLIEGREEVKVPKV